MSLNVLYAVLGALGFVGQFVLLVVLLARRQYKSFPVFTLYLAFNFVSDVATAALIGLYSQHAARTLFLASLPLQYMLELGVLLEIAWNVLKPVLTSLPKGTMRVFAGLIAGAVLCGTLLAWQVHDTGNKVDDLKGPFDITVGLLRMLIFAATAGFAQMLGIGWKNKVLQLATALSFYSAVDLIVSLTERHADSYHALEPIRGAAYVLEVGFLVWAFTTKDVRRREFSPQMEQILVTLAGRVKLARTALVRMQVK
jgi:hypothetical protein